MTKKQLNIDSVTNELQGASKYFDPPKKEITATLVEANRIGKSPAASATQLKEKDPQENISSLPTRARHLRTPTKQDSKRASKQASVLASSQDAMVLDIRKSVKEVGRETLFLRLTSEEKDKLKDIVYSLSKQRPRISDNEVGRIAINYLLKDYSASGKNSILVRVIDALNA